MNPWLPLEKHIYSYHMFLFFFISGYLYKQQPIGRYLRKKITSILIPFIAWNVLSSLVELSITHDLLDVVDKFFVLHGEGCWNAPLWFLLTLFLCEVIYSLVNSVWCSKFVPYIVFCCGTILWFLYGSSIMPLKLNLLPLALFSFSFGDIFSKVSQAKEYNVKFIGATLCITALLSILFGVILNIRISYTAAKFGNLFYCYIAAISGCVFFSVLFDCYEQIAANKCLCFWGRNSMIIMIMQYWFFEVFELIGSKTFGISIWNYRGTLKALVVSIITISPILLCSELVKNVSNKNEKIKYISKLFGFSLFCGTLW